MLQLILCITGLTSLLFIRVQGNCIDIHSQKVSQGLHYVPGPNPCTLCICDSGSPKWCKSVLCSPPQHCKSFQIGNSCCEFKCLDDILTSNDGYKDDLPLRLVISAVTAILSLSLLFFLLHCLKRRKIIRQNRQLRDERRSLNSIGYIAGSLGYLSGNIGYFGSGASEIEFHYDQSSAHYSLWKPVGVYPPRDEAPPPYEEAVRTAQAEQEISNSQLRAVNNSLPAITSASHHSSHGPAQQQSLPSVVPCRHEYAINNFNSGHEYSNISVPNIAVYQNSSALKENVTSVSNSLSELKYAQQQEKNSRASEKSRSYENVLVSARVERSASSSKQRPEHTLRHRSENTCARGHPNPTKKKTKTDATKTTPRDKNYFYENTKHRTIPNLLEYQLKESIKTNKEAALKSNDPHKSERPEGTLRGLISLKDVQMHSTLPSNLRDLAVGDVADCAHKFLPKQVGTFVFHAKHGSEVAHAAGSVASSSRSETPKNKGQGREERQERHSFISYQYLSSPDEDDYRSECENCKSSGLTNMDDEEADILNETMTLQRRPLEPGEEVPYYRTSLTLPTNTKKPRPIIQNPGRESWFIAMQETSSSDESE